MLYSMFFCGHKMKQSGLNSKKHSKKAHLLFTVNYIVNYLIDNELCDLWSIGKRFRY